MKRAISFIFIFLMLLSGMSGIITAQAHGADEKILYQVNLFDQKGRLLPDNNSAIGANLQSIIYTERYIMGIPVGWQAIGKYSGGQFQFKAPIGQKAKIVVFWYNKEQYDNVFYLSTDEVINITLPFVPCVPIMDVRAESLGVSSDIHEINTAHYNVKFGMGRDKNEIWITLGTHVYTIPVSLSMATGSNSEKKPFQFLAQAPNTTVKGKESFLIWTTGEYISGVKTYKIGDNGLIVVWTYMYADVASAWVSKVLAGALMGAIAGTVAEPGIGTIAGGLAGGLAAGVAWALKPELANISAHAAIGVVAGYFTPRWFIIQGTSGLGTNSTTGTVSIDESAISPGMLVDGQRRWDIYTQSNTIQVAYTKYWGTGLFSKYYDFEDQVIPPHEDSTPYGTSTVSSTFQISTAKVYAGKYSLKLYNGNLAGSLINLSAMYNFKSGEYAITIDSEIYHTESIATTMLISIKTGSSWHNSEDSGQIATNTWVHVIHTYDISITNNNSYVYLSIVAATSSYPTYVDNLHIKVYDLKTTRITFDTIGSDEAVIVKHVFNTIPEIAPVKGKATQLTRSYTMIAMDVSGTDGFVALDWASPQVTVYYSRLYIRTATDKETAWLFFTDDKEGFKNVTFLITEPKNFVYHIDLFRYYALSTPDNWTFTPDWSPVIVNKTMIFLPPKDWNGMTLYSIWDNAHYNLASWWQNIGTWGHLALMGLAGLIIFIIILIVAPWLIFALIEILGLVIRGTVKGLGVAAKGFGELMKSRKRR